MDSQPFDPRYRDPGVRANPAAIAATGAVFGSARASPPVVHLLTRSAPMPAQEAFRRIEDREFLQLSRAYALHGGLAAGEQVAWCMRREWDQPVSTLAKWIVRREVVNLVWRSQILVPVFQFSGTNMQVRPVVRQLLAELRDVFDDWEITAWFAQPNAFLRDERPLDLINVDDAGLLQAARTDRFVARG